MTNEEFQAFIATDDGKVWFEGVPGDNISGYISPVTITALVDEAKKPLLSKRDELLEEIRKSKDTKKTVEEQLSGTTRYLNLLEDYNIGVDSDGKLDYSKVEEVLRDLRSGKSDPGAGATPAEIIEAQRQLKGVQRDLDMKSKEVALRDSQMQDLHTEIDTRDVYIHDLLISNAMRAALGKEGYAGVIIDNILPSLVAKSGAQVSYDETKDTNKWSAITEDNRSIEEWVKYWATTEEGIVFKPGKINSGGGAGGSGNPISSKSWKDMSQAEKMDLFRKDRIAYDKLKVANG